MSVRRLAAAALAASAVLAVAPPPGTAAPRRGAHLAVARVARLTGPHRFYVERHRHLVRLHVGDRIRRHELVVLGPSTHALLRLLLGPRSPVGDDDYVLNIQRYRGRRPPPQRRLKRQWALFGHAAKTRRWLLIAPRLLELRP